MQTDILDTLRRMTANSWKDEAIAEIERLRTALLELQCRDDRNGSLPPAYRKIIDTALEQKAPEH